MGGGLRKGSTARSAAAPASEWMGHTVMIATEEEDVLDRIFRRRPAAKVMWLSLGDIAKAAEQLAF